MIKKIIAILTICLMLTGTVVYAEDTATSTQSTSVTDSLKTNSHPAKSRLGAKLQNLKTFFESLKPQLEQIKANKNEIKILRQTMATEYKNAKARIKELQKNKASLTKDQLEQLKAQLKTLQKDRADLEKAGTDIAAELKDLRAARLSRDPDAYKKAIDNLLALQTDHMNKLKLIIDDLKKVG